MILLSLAFFGQIGSGGVEPGNVPEPGTLALLLAGVGPVGVRVLRRRRA
ncbi:MAG: hypothetical protein C4321_06020 [Chloroflexota bacterium]